MRVLVVDDEEPLRKILARWVHQFGYDVTAVGSAEAAVAEMTRARADIVVTDITMPNQNGLWLIDRIREEWPQTVVIVESGALEPATVLRTRHQGAVDFLPKPFGREMVHQALQRAAAHLAQSRV